MFQMVTQGYPRLPKVFQGSVPRPWACMQLHKLACRKKRLHCSCISMHAVTYASMQLHKLVCSYIILDAVPWACMQFHELACSSMSLYAVPFFVWGAHKNFAVLVDQKRPIVFCHKTGRGVRASVTFVTEKSFFGSDRSSRKANVRSFVRSFVRSSVPSLSEALNLHLFFIMTSGWLQDDRRSSGWQEVFRMTSGWLQNDLRMTQSTQRA